MHEEAILPSGTVMGVFHYCPVCKYAGKFEFAINYEGEDGDIALDVEDQLSDFYAIECACAGHFLDYWAVPVGRGVYDGH